MQVKLLLHTTCVVKVHREKRESQLKFLKLIYSRLLTEEGRNTICGFTDFEKNMTFLSSVRALECQVGGSLSAI